MIIRQGVVMIQARIHLCQNVRFSPYFSKMAYRKRFHKLVENRWSISMKDTANPIKPIKVRFFTDEVYRYTIRQLKLLNDWFSIVIKSTILFINCGISGGNMLLLRKLDSLHSSRSLFLRFDWFYILWIIQRVVNCRHTTPSVRRQCVKGFKVMAPSSHSIWITLEG